MRNLHKDIKEKYGIEALQQLDRYNRAKARQVRKFHNLISKSRNIKATNNNNNGSSLGTNANSSDRPNNNRLNNNNSQLQDNINNKWVINLSNISLTEGQKSVLAKGLNYSLTPKFIPHVDFITAVETVFKTKRGGYRA